MKSAIAALLFLFLSVTTAMAEPASTPRKYAVLSVIGDSLTIVTFQPGTGSRLDRNVRSTIVLPSPVFDNTALLAVDEAIRKEEPGAQTALLSVPGLQSRIHQERVVEGQPFSPPEELTEALGKVAATHLFLVARHRSEAGLPTTHGRLGSGTLEGLGFYIDGQTRLKRADTGESGIGFLAPYAYFSVSLIELPSMKVLRQQRITSATTLSSARNTTGADAWGALSSSRKIAILREFVTREIAKAIPVLVRP